MTNTPPSTDSFDGIQYLRAIAALMVVAHHARTYFGNVSAWTDFGAHGVAIFFIISGFIMVHATRGFNSSENRIDQACDFFVRRIIRVLPLYWLALLYQNKRMIFEGKVDWGLVSDFIFIPRFNVRSPLEIWPSLILGWTINYEMEFYLIFAMALLFGKNRLIISVSAIIALVLAGHLWKFESAPIRFWTTDVIGEFVLGIGVYHLINLKVWAPNKWLIAFTLVAGFAGLTVPESAISPLVAYGPFAALIVWSGVYIGRFIRPLKWLHLIGDASYSIYLSRGFTFTLGFKICDALNLELQTPFNIALSLLLLVAFATLIGIAVHFLLEKPLLRVMQKAWHRNSMRRAPQAQGI